MWLASLSKGDAAHRIAASLQPLINGVDVKPWPGLSASLNSPPELEGAELDGDVEQSHIAEIGGGSKVSAHKGRDVGRIEKTGTIAIVPLQVFFS